MTDISHKGGTTSNSGIKIFIYSFCKYFINNVKYIILPNIVIVRTIFQDIFYKTIIIEGIIIHFQHDMPRVYIILKIIIKVSDTMELFYFSVIIYDLVFEPKVML